MSAARCEAGIAGGAAPCVLNAANEVAVHAFLEQRLGFLGIAAVVERTLDRIGSSPLREFASLFEADREARAVADELVERTGAPPPAATWPPPAPPSHA